MDQKGTTATKRSSGAAARPHGRELAVLALGAVGVVFGDIGTSPLYAIRECFVGLHSVAPTRDNVLGVLSLIFWALVLVLCIKYLVFMMRADNRGEGGIMALLALVQPRDSADGGRGRWLLLAVALFGAALLYGDGMITPAISVLSAVEGLRVATPVFEPFVAPITVVILLALFLFQRRGTGRLGAVFGPVTLVWFGCIALLGVVSIAREPGVLAAVSPTHAVAFFAHNGWHGFLTLGWVFLVVTGGEALYADMGHFGRRPIRFAWFSVVLPALLLNYFGQGALLVRTPEAATDPFYHLVPGWALYPMVALATAATVIASQALISAAFSLTRQAVQLGYSPRVTVVHTSARRIGQIYIPGVNWALMAACIGLVVGFRSSSALAAAYGVAVTTTMVIETLLAFVVARDRWGWSVLTAGFVAAFFLTIDLSFFGANIVKIADGGWFPLAVGAVAFTLLSTWSRGRRLLSAHFRMRSLPIELFVSQISAKPPTRVPGTAVFMTRDIEGVPPVLLHHLKHNQMLHENVVLLSILTAETPVVPIEEQVQVDELGAGLYRVVARFGFTESPSVPAVLAQAREQGLVAEPMRTTFYLGRETLLTTERPGMARWRKRLFAFMSRNARSATSFFDIPPNRVVELGAQIEF